MDPWDLICILEAHTTGKPKKLIQSHMNNGSFDPQQTLNEINDEPFRRFGSGTKVAITLTSKLNSFQAIKDVHQVDKIEELLEICKSIKTNLPYLQELQEFNNSSGMTKICMG